MVDHRRHHAPKAQIEAHLDGYQNDGKHDPDHSCNQTQPVMKQIPECEGENQWHVIGARLPSVQCQFGLHAPRTPRNVSLSRKTGSAPAIAAAIDQLMIRVPLNTITALPIAIKSVPSSAY